MTHQTYLGTKRIAATPMTRLEYNAFRGWDIPADENGADEGFLVEYLDGGKPNVEGYAGYVSWSPKEQFDKAYRATTGGHMTFGQALESLKLGRKVRRAAWKGYIGSSPYLTLIESAVFSVQRMLINDGPQIKLYSPAQDEMFADDWEEMA